MKNADVLQDFLREQSDFAKRFGIKEDNWEADYLARPKPERDKIQAAWVDFLHAFNRRHDF